MALEQLEASEFKKKNNFQTDKPSKLILIFWEVSSSAMATVGI